MNFGRESDIHIKDDKIFFFAEKFYAEDFNKFRKRCESFLIFVEHYEDEESKNIKKEVRDFLLNSEKHRQLLIRQSWGDNADNLISYTDSKPEPSYDDVFEELLIKLDDKMRDYMNQKIKLLYPTKALDLTQMTT